MALNPSIILSGRTPNFLAIQDAANNAAQSQIQNLNQNALTQYVRQNGAGIMAGDRNALAGYAAFDPQSALAMQSQQEQMSMRREEFAMRKAEIARQTAAELEAKKGQLDAAALEKERQQLESALTGAFPIWEKGDPAAFAAYVSGIGLDPSIYTLENFPSKAAEVEGVLDGIAAWQKVFQPEVPEWTDLTPEELAQYGLIRGQRNTKTGKVEGTSPPKGQSITVGADGSLQITEGVGVGGATAGDMISDSAMSPSGYTSDIDAIINDPALGRVTGLMGGGGGNSVDDFNFMQRAYYAAADAMPGSEGDSIALIEKIGNLQNKTWLAARDMLKGGGAITDYESRKAEAAMSRLSRAKSTEEMKDALTDLRDAIRNGEAKLAAAGKAPGATQGGPTRKRYNPATGAFE